MSGRKTFTAGEVLQAADVNDYLMDQSVMVFAGTAARGSAIPSPTEGMVTYRSDDDAVEVYDGSAWSAVGSSPTILQVLQTVKTDAYSVSLATGAMDTQNVPGLDVTITPSSASSKILIMVAIGNNENVGHIQLFRDGSLLTDAIGDASGSRTRATQNGKSTIVFLDSPGTTSAVTYGIRIGNLAGGTATVYLNTFNAINSSRISNTIATNTAMEVFG